MVFAMLLFLAINYPVRYIWLYDRSNDRVVAELKSMVYNYASACAETPRALEPYYVENIGMYSGYSILIMDADGYLLTDTDDSTMAGISLKEADPEFVEEVFKNKSVGYKVNTTLSRVLTRPCIVAYDRVVSAEVGSRYVMVAAPYSKVDDMVEEELYKMNAVGLFTAVVAGIICLGYTIYYTKATRYIIRMTAEYADGKFDKKVKRRHFTDENEEIANAVDCLAEKNEGLIGYQKNFVANISHDFRSPLTSIRGYTVALKDGTIPYERQGKYLDIILFETDRLSGLTQNILDLSEFDSNAVKLNLTDFDICRMIKQSAATFEAICASKKIKIRLIIAEKSIMVNADRPKIQQVVHNLVDNAIKFSNESSMIQITISEKDDKVYVSVRDHGIGIPKDSLGQVWERFFKTDLSRGKDKKGTGLGLSITKQIINAHGEKIMVDSEVGEGTEFTFSLAKSQSKAAEEKPAEEKVQDSKAAEEKVEEKTEEKPAEEKVQEDKAEAKPTEENASEEKAEEKTGEDKTSDSKAEANSEDKVPEENPSEKKPDESTEAAAEEKNEEKEENSN